MRNGTAGTAASETLTVLILARNEADNLDRLLPALAAILAPAGLRCDTVVIDANSPDGTAEVARQHGARVVMQSRRGYANALREGLAQVTGDYILTLDADLSHPPRFVADMLAERHRADVVIASRYVQGGAAAMPVSRRLLSRALNGVYQRLLRLPVRDLSSGFRLYRRGVLAGLTTRGEHFDVLPEIVTLVMRGGHTVCEIPFRYEPRAAGVSKARLLVFAPSYVRTLWRCARMRAR